jgi:hypothetical protein
MKKSIKIFGLASFSLKIESFPPYEGILGALFSRGRQNRNENIIISGRYSKIEA